MCTGFGLVAGPGKVGFRSLYTVGLTATCVVGVWVVRCVRTRHARVAGVNAIFETAGTCVVRRGGAAEGGRVAVVGGGRALTGGWCGGAWDGGGPGVDVSSGDAQPGVRGRWVWYAVR